MAKLPRFDTLKVGPLFKPPHAEDEPPTITTLEDCPDCEGEGFVYQEIHGGRWNNYIGTWEPDEDEVPCETCGGDPDRGPSRFKTGYGTGTVTVERCGICGHPTEGNWSDHGEGFCECDEDVIEQVAIGDAKLQNLLERLRDVSYELREKLDLRHDPAVHGLPWNQLHRFAARRSTKVEYTEGYLATEITLGGVNVLLFGRTDEA